MIVAFRVICLRHKRMGHSMLPTFVSALMGLSIALAQTDPARGTSEPSSGAKAITPKTDEASCEPASSPPNGRRPMEVSGKVIDDVTGEPVAPVYLQTGVIDSVDRKKVNWGGSLEGGVEGDSTFKVILPRGDGLAARVVAAGYRPEPVMMGDLDADLDSTALTVRLRRGRSIRGAVVDHMDRPVANASVIAVGPMSVNLSAAKFWKLSPDSRGMKFDKVDATVRSVETDEKGRFEIAAGHATTLVVSHNELVGWPVTIPEQGEPIIRLPQPAQLEIEYAIEGGGAECRIVYEMQTHQAPGFEGVTLSQVVSVKSGEREVLTALPPGPYHVFRLQSVRLGRRGKTFQTDREAIELKPGKRAVARIARDRGARLSGKVLRQPSAQGDEILITLLSEGPTKSPFDVWRTGLTYTAVAANGDGTFRTEKIAAGRYRVRAETWGAPDPGQVVPRVSSQAERLVDVPDGGEFEIPDLMLK